VPCVRTRLEQGRRECNGARVVSPGELGALARRHLVAVTMIFLLAGGVAYSFKHAPPTYQESATLVLTSHGGSNRYGDSLIATAGIMVNWTTGVQGQQELRQAGVASGFNVALVNIYDQEYPNYPYPFVTVSASAQDPVVAHRMFAIGVQLFDSELLARQVKQGVLPQNLITALSVGDSGPVILRGSRVRSFAGLLLLTTVVAFLTLTLLDRHPIRPRGLLRARWRGPGAPGRTRLADRASAS
jgi:hypothetical protein